MTAHPEDGRAVFFLSSVRRKVFQTGKGVYGHDKARMPDLRVGYRGKRHKGPEVGDFSGRIRVRMHHVFREAVCAHQRGGGPRFGAACDVRRFRHTVQSGGASGSGAGIQRGGGMVLLRGKRFDNIRIFLRAEREKRPQEARSMVRPLGKRT